MKKFVNDPQAVRARDAGGHRARQPGHARVRPGVQPDHAGRRAARRQGLDRPGLRLRPRAGARDGRRQGHARRRLPRRRVRRAADGLRATRRPSCWPPPKGVLLLVNNYTGDRMAFDMGKEMAEAEGIKVETLIIDDDVAVKDSTYTVGRRGVAGNFFVIKAVGAAAEQGADLDELHPHRREGQRRHPHDGHGADRLHAAGQGLAAVRARRRRDGDGRRHPRRAGPRARRSSTGADEIVDELLEAVVPRPAVSSAATRSR